MVLALAVDALLIAIAGLGAMLRGGTVERKGVAVFIAGWLSVAAAWSAPGEPTHGPWLFLVDLILLVALVHLTWRSPRVWPIQAAGFQLLALAANVAGWVGRSLDRDLVLTLIAACGAAAVATLAIGAWLPARAR